MSAASMARRGQRAAERLMVDSCIIRRSTGEELNEDTGQVETTYDTVYEGVCKVQMNSSILTTSAQNIGGTITTVSSRYVHIPVSAPVVRVDDEVVVGVSQDGHLVGKVFRVVSPFGKTFATSRRLEVQEP